MSETEVAPQLTPVSAQSLYDALGSVWPRVVGGTPARASLLVLLAQSAFEGGHWQSTYNYNLAGIKHVDGDGRDYFIAACSEVIDGQTLHMLCPFRSFPMLSEGAIDYLGELYRHFHGAWPALLSGDPERFAYALKSAGYYTGDASAYAAGLLRYVREFDRTIPQLASPRANAWPLVFEFIAVGTSAYVLLRQWRSLPASVQAAQGASTGHAVWRLGDTLQRLRS